MAGRTAWWRGEEGTGLGASQQIQNRAEWELFTCHVPRWKASPGVMATANNALFLASREVLMGGLFVTQIKPKWVQN